MQVAISSRHAKERYIFSQPSVTNAQCITGTEKNPDTGINCNYEHDKFSQAHVEIIFCFS